MLNTELMRGARSRLTAVQEEWGIRNALEADENITLRPQEPELQPCRAQGHIQHRDGVDENPTVKDGIKPDVHRRGSVRGTSVGLCEPVDPIRKFFFCKKPGHQKKDCRSYASWKTKVSEKRGEM